MFRMPLILGAIPLVTFAVLGPLGKSKPQEVPIVTASIVPIAVMTEGVREQRQDSETFRYRFDAALALPPMIEIREVRRDRTNSSSNSTTVGRNAEMAGDPVSEAAAFSPPAPQPSRHRFRLRSRPVKMDICAAHRMRRVMVGKYRWRCRR